MVLSMENVSWKIFGDGFSHKCMEMTVARPTTKRRARNPHYLEYGLGKAEYSSLANKSFKMSRSHALSYAIRT
jgi:hypothetical protein